MSQDLEAPIFISVTQAAQLLGLSRWTVYKLLDSKAIAGTKHGDKRLVVRESVMAYADRLLEESA